MVRDDAILPCSGCGRDLLETGESTTVEVEQEFEFGGQPAVRDEPAMECRECGAVTQL